LFRIEEWRKNLEIKKRKVEEKIILILIFLNDDGN